MGPLDQLRNGARRAGELPKRSVAGIKAGGGRVAEVPERLGRVAGRARRSASRTSYRIADRVRSVGQSDDGSRPAGVAEAASGESILDRARANPRIATAIVGGALLLLAWIGWAIYVTTEHGASAGLGVVISWPVLLAALGLVALPFVGGYMLVQRLRIDENEGAGDPGDAPEDAEEEPEDEEGDEDEPADAEETEDGGDEDDAGEGEDSDEDAEAKASFSG